MFDVAIIGAGPAGLTAAHQLAVRGMGVVVLEADPQYVGGISRTVEYKGFRFDIGGHRFFSKSAQIEAMWEKILGPDLLERPRSSRILYGGNLYSYPLRPLEALMKLGPVESALCFLSYLHAQLFPNPDPRSFEEWVTREFGARLFRIFFRTYTEKVWGMSCTEISADWAAQRIKGLSLWSAVRNALWSKQKADGDVVKSLIGTFRYPRLGPGMMWERCAAQIREMGGQVLLGRKVNGLAWNEESGKWRVGCEAESYTARHVISSAPLRELVGCLEPKMSPRAAAAAEGLRYRDFLTVALIAKDRGTFSDNWIYIHEPSVLVGRVQNYKSWSPEMVPDPALCCYGMEYFCNQGDELWNGDDKRLTALAAEELAKIGLGRQEDIVDACVVRQAKAYPVYDDAYAGHVAAIRSELDAYPNLHLVGRNGMHRYNNQDHAMMTAMLTAENILAQRAVYDVWQVNQDAEYIESQAGAEADREPALQSPVLGKARG